MDKQEIKIVGLIVVAISVSFLTTLSAYRVANERVKGLEVRVKALEVELDSLKK